MDMALTFENRCRLIELSIKEYFKESKVKEEDILVDKWEGS